MLYNNIILRIFCYLYGIISITLRIVFNNDIKECDELSEIENSYNYEMFTLFTTINIALASFGIPFLFEKKKKCLNYFLICKIIFSMIFGIIHLFIQLNLIYNISKCNSKVKIFNFFLSTNVIIIFLSVVFFALFIIISLFFEFIKKKFINVSNTKPSLQYTQFELYV